jgi:choloylglycine hydrolase
LCLPPAAAAKPPQLMHKYLVLTMLLLLPGLEPGRACSILYYIDTHTGKIYAVNNEDYWYDVKTY